MSLSCFFASIIQKPAKFFPLRFSWKFVHQLILGWWTQRLYLFSKMFSSLFLLWLFKSHSAISQKKIFPRFSWKLLCNLILMWRVRKCYSFYQNFFFLAFIFGLKSQKSVKNELKTFFSRCAWKVKESVTLIWGSLKIILIFFNFFILVVLSYNNLVII